MIKQWTSLLGVIMMNVLYVLIKNNIFIITETRFVCIKKTPNYVAQIIFPLLLFYLNPIHSYSLKKNNK